MIPCRDTFRRCCALLSPLALVHADLRAAVPLEFGSPDILASDGGTTGSAAGDLDGDGRTEFVAQDHFAIYDWNGGGWDSSRPLPNVDDRLDRFAGDIEIGDINGDGWPDIVLTDSSNSGNTGELVWFENPDGNLSGDWTEHSVSVWNDQGTGDRITHSEEELGDIDGDGLLDIVVRDIRHGFWVHLQRADGGWHERRFVPTRPREGLDLWDPDGDGDLDVLLNGVWFETPADPVGGTYVEHAIHGMEAWYPSGSSEYEINDYACKVVAADLNGDGRDDIVISNAEELMGATTSKPRGIRAYLQPAGSLDDPWTEIVLESNSYSWHSLEVVDLDFDGDLDVFSAISTVGVDSSGPGVAYWAHEDDGSWTKVTVSTDIHAYQGLVGDGDGNGTPDLFLPEAFATGPVRFLANSPTIQIADPYDEFVGRSGLTGAEADAAADPDADGLANGIEFVLGTAPEQATGAAERPSAAIDGSDLVFTFRRSSAAEASASPTVEYGTDLATFTPAREGVDGVRIETAIDGYGTGIDRVTVRLPLGLASDGRLFARLSATID